MQHIAYGDRFSPYIHFHYRFNICIHKHLICNQCLPFHQLCAMHNAHTLPQIHNFLFLRRHRAPCRDLYVCNSKIIVASYPFCFISIIKLEYRLKLNIITFFSFYTYIIYLSLKLSSSFISLQNVMAEFSIRWKPNIEQLLTVFICCRCSGVFTCNHSELNLLSFFFFFVAHSVSLANASAFIT